MPHPPSSNPPPPPSDPTPFWIAAPENNRRASLRNLHARFGEIIYSESDEDFIDLITDILHRAAQNEAIKTPEQAQTLIRSALSNFDAERQDPSA